MVTRTQVLNSMVFLIVVTILVNLYTLVLVMSNSSENPLRVVTKRVPEQKRSPPSPTDDSNDHKVLTVGRNEIITTMRFVRDSHGRMTLYIPEGSQMTQAELEKLGRQILRRLDAMGYPKHRSLSGNVRLVNRMKRALVGSSSALGISVDNEDYARGIWAKASQWPVAITERAYSDISLGEVLQFASQAKILQAKSSRKGTQLKLHLVLDGGQVALFKPKWYPRDVQLKGDVFGGKDRHFGEIAAFYLSQILGFNNAPITVGRKLNLVNEILPVSTTQLKGTFSISKENNHCFYGSCYYCSPKDPVCGDGETLEGALVLLMNQKIKLVRNPWQRNYKSKDLANWQVNMSYCHNVTFGNVDTKDQVEFLLDAIGVSIFDFLIGNGDRHTFDVLERSSITGIHNSTKAQFKQILLIDNGKSFGNSFEDYLDILAPLYQCCRIRKELWETLNDFGNDTLGETVDFFTQTDPLYPLLTSDHLTALNQRLKIVRAVVEDCIYRLSMKTVIM